MEPIDISGYIRQMKDARTVEGDTAIGRLAEAQAAMAEEMASHVLAESTVLTLTGNSAQEAEANGKRLLQLLAANGSKAHRCDPERIGHILQVCYGHAPVPLSEVVGGVNALLQRGKAGSERAARSPKRGEIRLAPEEGDVLSKDAVRLSNILTPSAVVERPGQLDLGGSYAASLVVVAYPERATNAWLERLLHFTHKNVCRRVSMFIEPISSAKAVQELQRKLLDLDVNSRWSMRRGMGPDIATEIGLEDAEQLPLRDWPQHPAHV